MALCDLLNIQWKGQLKMCAVWMIVKAQNLEPGLIELSTCLVLSHGNYILLHFLLVTKVVFDHDCGNTTVVHCNKMVFFIIMEVIQEIFCPCQMGRHFLFFFFFALIIIGLALFLFTFHVYMFKRISDLVNRIL